MQISVNFNQTVGKIKPLHAVNNAPIMGLDDSLFRYLKEAHIPYSRLHDTGGVYGGFRFVDIENIFRDFDADVDDPASYDFGFTDWLLERLVEQGCEPFFRLGATIENYHRIRAYRIFPPKDNQKWAEICEHIVRHYNCGWADGYHMNITYWEIWNEPDNEPDIADNPMWKGTKEQYFALYETTANYLKKCYPSLKIGGYASCGFYALYEDGFVADAHSSSRTGYFIEFFRDFLKFISSEEHKSPLDFFSWHSYAGSGDNISSADYVRRELDKYGFTETESFLNEWNPGIARRGTEADACYIAEMICSMHRTPVDMLNYYDGQVNGTYNGLFDPVKLTIFPAYYALHAFGELYVLGREAQVTGDKLPLVAATDGEVGKIFVANKEEEPMTFDLTLAAGWRVAKYRVLQGIDGLLETDLPNDGKVTVPASKIVLLECVKA